VRTLYLMLLCLIALTIVILIRVVGIILLIALMTMPAAAASVYTKSLKAMMAAATMIGALSAIMGVWLSYSLNLPAGALIVLISSSAYFLSLTASSFFKATPN
jgi:zinc transport system permease protein